ncbi:hypothetical protein RB623_10975 [Mesorhizobium sp. LHD-90]|uniref:hypothetical protein n=1 Tax=Mesorhizobium sp. LHD-90 TaxID=3071414 RepID=UPI0027E09A3C|nr:hypothetical protein [Mesorhizobium sp. LHD-90]MDQ6434569.1 hypothetical protein [Mesorhizobium sp. LHD-90]
MQTMPTTDPAIADAAQALAEGRVQRPVVPSLRLHFGLTPSSAPMRGRLPAWIGKSKFP